jgi:hypothetical protein
VGYSQDSNDVSTEAEESPLSEAVARERLVKPQQTGYNLARSDFWIVEIGDSALITSSYDM